ncbi:hypothetical protein IS481_16910 [Caldimonas thermodepolymerans]|uniref:hypothetical protein n=1 Tax=Caldimonas thermodepolymerans TaxID=215580 RepID=UPI000CEA6DE4|nr:hypothetical protein [Caldimonas thermodepolymerans]QPC31377.1 hypothetical protein IS481_16910 [Caldimonas thermodepolymerans]RDH99656.1 hypothetical protein DES46_105138 [Caldimonas thermodepolymerans]
MIAKCVWPLVAGVSLMGAAIAEEADARWVELAATDAAAWYGKTGSGRVTNVDGKKGNGYAYVYQLEDKKKHTYSYGQVVVLLESCPKGYGYVYYNDTQGQYVNKGQFVRFGDTVVDALGSAACASWDSETGKRSRVEAEGTWKVVATAKGTGNRFSLKTDTVRKAPYDGQQALHVLFAFEDVTADTTDYGEFVVPLADCRRGYGTVHELDFSGQQVSKSDFVLDGNSVISAIAANMCAYN